VFFKNNDKTKKEPIKMFVEENENEEKMLLVKTAN